MIVTDKTILHQVSKVTTKEEVDNLNLIAKLREANALAWTEGAGLASIQIGVPLRFAWFINNEREYTLLNPKIITRFGSNIEEEGCLSIPNMWIKIKRAYEIEYVTDGKPKRAEGFKARLIQHEIDHMNGILITDYT